MQLEMVARPCPVCGSTDDSRVFAEADFDVEKLDSFAFASRKLPEYMHYRLLVCPTCGLLYANPVPTLETLAMAYEEAAFDSGEEAQYAARTYGGFLPSILRRLPDRDGALDIGTGEGAFLEQLLARGFQNVLGVEPSAAPIAAAKANIRPLIRHGLFCPEAFAPQSFRLITCFQTMEHLSDPLAMCRSAYSLLKDGGALFLIGHNRQALSARLLGLKSPIFDIEHLQLFSPQSARAMLERAGFTDITLQPVVNRYPLRYWLRLFPLPTGFKQTLLCTLQKTRVGSLPLTVPVGNLAAIGYRRGPSVG